MNHARASSQPGLGRNRAARSRDWALLANNIRCCSPAILVLLKLPNTHSLPRITPDKLKLMTTDYESGMSAYELAEKYSHNRGTIMKHLAQAGVRSRVAVPTSEEVSHWRELHAEGLGFKTIARRVGRNHKTIRKYLG